MDGLVLPLPFGQILPRYDDPLDPQDCPGRESGRSLVR